MSEYSKVAGSILSNKARLSNETNIYNEPNSVLLIRTIFVWKMQSHLRLDDRVTGFELYPHYLALRILAVNTTRTTKNFRRFLHIFFNNRLIVWWRNNTFRFYWIKSITDLALTTINEIRTNFTIWNATYNIAFKINCTFSNGWSPS
jgi:hypothetical protein